MEADETILFANGHMNSPIELIPASGPVDLPTLENLACVFIGVTQQGEVVQLWVPAQMRDMVLGYTTEPDGSKFRSTQTEISYTGKVSVSTQSGTRLVDLPDLNLAFPHVSTFPDGSLVIASSRCRSWRDGSRELNAKVYRADGSVEAEFCLGDAIEHLQTDAAGRIWVGYSDEGVFGNYGWGPVFGQENPIGETGLVCFDRTGKSLWEYSPLPDFPHIADCYALNVSGDSVWACYYTDFPIVRIDATYGIKAWQSDLSGTSQIAVSDDMVLAFGGYMEKKRDCWLLRLSDEYDYAERVDQVQLCFPEDVSLDKATVIGRGRFLHVLVRDRWFRFEVPALSD